MMPAPRVESRSRKRRTKKPRRDDLGGLLHQFLVDELAVIERQRDRILARDDATAVHRARVATRRMRSVSLSLGANAEGLVEEARWLSHKLGAVRDCDVLLEAADPSATNRFAHDVALVKGRALKRLRHAFRSRHYQSFVAAVHGAARMARKRREPVAAAAYEYIRLELKAVKKAGRSIEACSPPRALHKLRIRCKRLRYLIDFFGGHPALDLQPLAREVEPLQDLLGELQDDYVALRALDDFSARLGPDSRGRDHEIATHTCQRQTHATDLRAHFPKVWAQFDRDVTRKQLRRAVSAHSR
jgi:CHAD domain-containing protein